MAGTWDARIEEAKEFKRRCEAALSAARCAGDAAWKIEGLEEAVADSQAAIEDMERLRAS